MNNAELPGKPRKPSEPIDDIPEAVREASDPSPKTPFLGRWLIWSAVGMGAIGLAITLGLALRAQQASEPNPAQPTIAANPSGSVSPSGVATPVDTLLGHYPYKEAPEAELQPIVADGSIRLRAAAAKKFQEMVDAAAADGVILVPISGFRALDEQQSLFFDVKEQRGQVAVKRAEVSAPPGYSEHHTGYAIDIGDGNVPATDLNPNFENTAAFKWLQAHSAEHSFELSFPKNNPQGVNYEPWHWRFAGDRNSLETFYKARSQKPGS